ncbi:MAG: Hpt domain-containing protein, partial [Desulfuromonadales bacterium]
AADLNKLPVLETRAVLENLDFSLELYQELIGIYRATCAGLGDELAEILAGDNLKDIRTSAHSLKGIVSSIGGKRLEEVTSQIQNMCHEGKKPAVSVWAALVKAESSALNAAIASINWEAMRKFVKENKP